MAARLENELEGYNRRSLTETDLDQACDLAGVVLIYHPLPAHGLLFRRHDCPVIAVNQALPPVMKTFVGFHEYFHHRLHPGQVHTYRAGPNWLDQVEPQASVLAALAVAPTPLVEQSLRLNSLTADLADLPGELIQFRLRIHDRYPALTAAPKDRWEGREESGGKR